MVYCAFAFAFASLVDGVDVGPTDRDVERIGMLTVLERSNNWPTDRGVSWDCDWILWNWCWTNWATFCETDRPPTDRACASTCACACLTSRPTSVLVWIEIGFGVGIGIGWDWCWTNRVFVSTKRPNDRACARPWPTDRDPGVGAESVALASGQMCRGELTDMCFVITYSPTPMSRPPSPLSPLRSPCSSTLFFSIFHFYFPSLFLSFFLLVPVFFLFQPLIFWNHKYVNWTLTHFGRMGRWWYVGTGGRGDEVMGLGGWLGEDAIRNVEGSGGTVGR